MSDKKNWGHTVLGWFVVKEGGEAPLSPTEPEALPPEGDASTSVPPSLSPPPS